MDLILDICKNRHCISLSPAVRKTAIWIWVDVSNYNDEHLGALLIIWGNRQNNTKPFKSSFAGLIPYHLPGKSSTFFLQCHISIVGNCYFPIVGRSN